MTDVNCSNSNTKPCEKLLEWLACPSSLTAKAKTVCSDVRVEIINTKWLKDQHSLIATYQREIFMRCDKDLWWYAKSSMPKKTFYLREAIFSKLEDSPLGTILFTDPLIHRTTLNYFPLTMKNFQYASSLLKEESKTAILWQRLSEFIIEGEPLYLEEVFLPKMLERVTQDG